MSTNTEIIFRKKKVYFTQISNNILDDERISPQAFYIYSQIQRYITLENFTLNKDFLIKKSRMSEKTFDRYFKELRINGYLKSYQYPGIKGSNKVTIEYDLLDTPDTTTPYHVVYNSKGEVVQTFECANTNTVEKVESCTPPKMGGVQLEGGTKVGGLNNTNINNTNNNNNNNLSIYHNNKPKKKKTYCNEEDKEVIDGLIEELKDYTCGSFTEKEYKGFLNSCYGDVEIIKDVYDRMLLVASDETKKPIEKPVNYMNSSILKEFKKQYDVTL